MVDLEQEGEHLLDLLSPAEELRTAVPGLRIAADVERPVLIGITDRRVLVVGRTSAAGPGGGSGLRATFHVDDVTAQLPTLDHLEPSRLEPLLVVVSSVGREAARVDRPDVGDMDEVGNEAAQLALVEKAPRDRVVVAESGIASRAQGAEAELAGADAILVGSALMRAEDPEAKLAELISRPLVKVCGLTREEDVAVAAEAGADLLGFVLEPESPRAAPEVLAVPDGTLSVAVWVGEAGESPADLDQLHPREEGKVRGRDAVLLREGEVVARHLDLPWEEEDAGHWDRAAAADDRIVLAGRLGPDNVRAAIALVRPWGVDASSSLESAPGVKDHEKVRAYVEEARA